MILTTEEEGKLNPYIMPSINNRNHHTRKVQVNNTTIRGINNLEPNIPPPTIEKTLSIFQRQNSQKQRVKGRGQGRGGHKNREVHGGRGRGRPPFCLFCSKNQGHTTRDCKLSTMAQEFKDKEDSKKK